MSKSITTVSDEFRAFLDTFALFAESSLRVAALDHEVNDEVHAVIESHREEYLNAVAAQRSAAEALKEYAKLHPEWFGEKKSLKTPHGSVSKRDTTSLEIPNEALSVRLILATYGPVGTTAIEAIGGAAEFLHVTITPNREALEKLKDDELIEIGIARKKSEVITPKPLAIDLGKATATKAPEPTPAAKE